jgi:hypothetical protein
LCPIRKRDDDMESMDEDPKRIFELVDDSHYCLLETFFDLTYSGWESTHPMPAFFRACHATGFYHICFQLSYLQSSREDTLPDILRRESEQETRIQTAVIYGIIEVVEGPEPQYREEEWFLFVRSKGIVEDVERSMIGRPKTDPKLLMPFLSLMAYDWHSKLASLLKAIYINPYDIVAERELSDMETALAQNLEVLMYTKDWLEKRWRDKVFSGWARRTWDIPREEAQAWWGEELQSLETTLRLLCLSITAFRKKSAVVSWPTSAFRTILS